MERRPPPYSSDQRDILSITNSDHPNTSQPAAPGHFDDYTAAQVLASFNQYPIRASARQPPPGRLSYQAQSQHEGKRYDPLSADIQAAGRDLPHALYPILHRDPSRQISRDDPSLDLNHCRGVTGIGGAMVPGGANQRNADPNLNYATSAASPIRPPNAEVGIKPENFRSVSPPDNEQQFKTTFQFVVNENAKDARNTVRKHVMREFRRRERWEQGKKGPSESQGQQTGTGQKRRRRAERPTREEFRLQARGEKPVSPPRSEAGDKSESSEKSDDAMTSLILGQRKRPRFDPPSLPESRQLQIWGAVSSEYDGAIKEMTLDKSRLYESDPWAAVAPSEIDPFSRLKVELGPVTQSLLHHFAWVMPSLMDEIVAGTVFNRIGWLYSAVAVHDPTPVHVIVGFTLGHISGLRGIKEPPMAIEHKAKALQLINARMEDPEQATSDGSIGAVIHIAAYELIDCNPKGFALHMSGIHRMVSARGGMSAFKDNPDLETVLVRLDAIRAYVSVSFPRYPQYTTVRALQPLAINVPSRPPAWPGRTSSPCPIFEYLYCEDAISLLHGLEDVLLLIRSAALDLSGPVGPPFKKLLSASVRQLLSPSFSQLLSNPATPPQTPFIPTTSSDQHDRTPPPHHQAPTLRHRRAAHCLRLATLVFLDLAVREFFDAPPFPGAFARKLKARFLGPFAAAARASTAWGRSIEMLIAVLLQADRVALERPWRGWYVADVLTLTMKVGEANWEAATAALRGYLERDGNEEGDDAGDEVPINARSRGVWDVREELEDLLRQWKEHVPA